MLMKTPSRSPATAKKANYKGPVFKVSKEKRRVLIELMADVMRQAEPTVFAVESHCRHALRSHLCLQGWPWIIADLTSWGLVRAALHQIGARRPLWIEGQLGYCHSGYLRDDRCWRCGSPLPPWAKKSCSPECANVLNYFRWQQTHAAETPLYRRQDQSVWCRIRSRPLPALRSAIRYRT